MPQKKFGLLTRASMRKLPPGEKIIENNIEYLKLSNGDGRFYVNVRVAGHPRIHRVVGLESEGVTITQAQELIAQLQTEAREGRFNLPKGRKIAQSFEAVAAKYLERLEETGGKNIKAKARQLRDHLIPFFQGKPFAKLSTYDVERFKKQRLEAGAKPGTINRELSTLSHMLSQAIAWAWIDAKPFVVSRLKEENTRINYLTDAQVERLLEAASKSVNPHLYPFIRIGLETSMRKMEILSIRLEHIDLVRRRIFIPKSKTGARVQPITARLVDFLKPMMRSGETWLFPCKKSVTGHVVNIDKAYRQAVKAAGLDVKQVNRHTLRHTAITRLVNAGVPLTTVKNISGHKTLQMVERYTHQTGEHIMAAMDLLEASYQKAGSV